MSASTKTDAELAADLRVVGRYWRDDLEPGSTVDVGDGDALEEWADVVEEAATRLEASA